MRAGPWGRSAPSGLPRGAKLFYIPGDSTRSAGGMNRKGRQFMRSRILGVGTYVPDRVVTNEDLAKIFDTSDEWIRERTGIEERR